MTEEVNAEVEVKEQEVKAEAAAPEAETKTEDAAPEAEAGAADAEEAGEAEQDEGADEGEGEDEAGEDEEAEHGGDAAAAEATTSEPEKRKRESHVGPLTLGFKTFANSKACTDYFKYLLSTAPMDTDMNEYEYRILLDLIQKGHPSAAAKIGGGLRAFQVRHFNAETDSRAFFAIRKDGTLEDFSYVKCLGTIFPDEITLHVSKRMKTDTQNRRSSDGGRGGGGFRGRGRGGRRGGGRGRGGRGGGGRY
ncbi:hypothetical protein PLESTB_000121300 [Pleodorina starrii]|uniref:Uncharacterized protein n=1 Tax=Pleodorina starrii TaxID=330485 RepID=A0A9W6BAS1_9CHLO|nr:hypothetical protein PLESTB_000121300 [Pleodorina starrii]GLC76344.1 hypothetical protein PLESTF_001769500 [Pleodorina starrii]